jgi:energy-converting hydrogenase B subunit D
MTLISIVEIFITVLLVVLAFLAINSKSLIKSVMFLSALSMLSVIGFVLMKAPDVAVTEAVIGSGLVTSLFVFTLLSVKKVGAKA